MKDRYLITGGAGFIGTNLADCWLSAGHEVIVLDNFSRGGSEQNVRWLQDRHGSRLMVVNRDVRWVTPDLQELVENVDVVVHLAGQVAVTRSITNPREDFETNAIGTFNVLEAVRLSKSRPIMIYSSTNKVYGDMADIAVVEGTSKYQFAVPFDGVAETRPVEFYTPYGCSKGVGDQYVIDYARIYGLRTVVFRQSCIYGPRQFGVEDQGWVAWFAIRALQSLPILIYGNGKQVRDVLYVDDLVSAYSAAIDNISRTKGQVYNIGGGSGSTLSLLELLGLLADECDGVVDYAFANSRPADQLMYVSNIHKATADFGWEPRIEPQEGVRRLYAWLRTNRDLFDFRSGMPKRDEAMTPCASTPDR